MVLTSVNNIESTEGARVLCPCMYEKKNKVQREWNKTMDNSDLAIAVLLWQAPTSAYPLWRIPRLLSSACESLVQHSSDSLVRGSNDQRIVRLA